MTALGAAIGAPELVRAVVLYESVVAWAPGWDDRAMKSVLAGPDPEEAALRMMFADAFDRMAPEEQ